MLTLALFSTLAAPNELLFGDKGKYSEPDVFVSSLQLSDLSNIDIKYQAQHIAYLGEEASPDLQVDVSASGGSNSYLWESTAGEFRISDTVPEIQFRLSNENFQAAIGSRESSILIRPWGKLGPVSMFLASEKLPLTVEVAKSENNYTASGQIDLDQTYCTVSGYWRELSLSGFCLKKADQWRFVGGRLHADFFWGSLSLSRRESYLQNSLDWVTVQPVDAYSELNVESRTDDLEIQLYGWSLYLFQRQFSGKLFNEADIQDELLASVGKGTYYIYAQIDFSQQGLYLSPPEIEIGSWTFELPIGFTRLDSVSAHYDLYEPILFLGLPVVTEQYSSDEEDYRIVGLNGRMEWSSGPWVAEITASQLVPIASTEEIVDSSGASTIGSDQVAQPSSDSESATGIKKTGPFWPGFSVKFSVKFLL